MEVENKLGSAKGGASRIIVASPPHPGHITFDTELRLVGAPSLRDHFAHATVAQHFKAYEGQPLTIPAEAAGPNPEYLAWHREEVFGKQ